MKKEVAKTELENAARFHPVAGIRYLSNLCRSLNNNEFDRAIAAMNYSSGSFLACFYGFEDRYEVVACSKLNRMATDFIIGHFN